MSHTKGVVRYSQEFGCVTTSPIGVIEGSKNICDVRGFNKTKEEIDANGNLISDTFNLTNETGLTPREILAQRDKLVEALKKSQNLLYLTHLIHHSVECGKVHEENKALLNDIKNK